MNNSHRKQHLWCLSFKSVWVRYKWSSRQHNKLPLVLWDTICEVLLVGIDKGSTTSTPSLYLNPNMSELFSRMLFCQQ